MPTTVALSSYFENFIKQQIDSGRYNNASEVIRAGLRMLEEKEQTLAIEALKLAIEQGINSGEGKDAKTAFNRLKGKYQSMEK